MQHRTRREFVRLGTLAAGGIALAGGAAAQPIEEEPEETGALVGKLPSINLRSGGLAPVEMLFGSETDTSSDVMRSLTFGPVYAEPEHAAHVERFTRVRTVQGIKFSTVLFDPRTAVTWFAPGDDTARVQTTVGPLVEATTPVMVVGGRRLPDLAVGGVTRSGGSIVVTVENVGTADAGPSTTEVDFGSHGSEQGATSGLASGESVDVSLSIPPGCFDPDCDFTVTVDVDDDVSESNESNNVEEGRFIG